MPAGSWEAELGERGADEHIEGRQPVIEALRSDRRIRRIMISRQVNESAPIIAIRQTAARKGVQIEDVAPNVIDRHARTRSPQGVIAIAEPFSYASLDDVVAEDRSTLLVALDGVTDPHNLGAIARSAEAVGATGLIVPERRAAPVTATVEKAAAGALSHLPVVQAPNLARSLEDLKGRGVWVVALDADADDRIWDLELATEPLCLVVGAEGSGVSRLVRDRSDVLVRIPIPGRVSSLNASVAAGVALFEVLRRRILARADKTDSRP